MKVHIIPDPIRMRQGIYLEVGIGESGKRLYMMSDNSLAEVGMGEEAPLYTSIPNEIAEAIGEALAPRPDTTERHLEDAVVVRNRLLTLVEQRWSE